MATFIALITETQEGETKIFDSVKRAARFNEMASEFGATVTGQYWTMGAFDGVLIFDAPDDKAASALMFKLSAQGAVRTQTLPAYSAEEMQAMLERAGG
jgi:uncharacterized protein with GYD domain